MNFIFDLYGTLIDIWTDEDNDEFWEGVALLLGDGEENYDRVRREYRSLCKKAKRADEHEINLLSVFEEMLSSRGVDTAVAPALASEFRRMSLVRLRLFDGVKEMLQGLKDRGAGVHLLSNAQSCFTLDELHTVGIYDLFDGILISSDVGVKKPSAQIFAIAFDRFSVNPDDSIYVGNDMRDDVLGATAVGLRTVYIPTAQSGKYDGSFPLPTYSVSTHEELRALLFSLTES